MKLVPNSLGVCLLFAIIAVSIGSTAMAQRAQTDVYFADQIWPGNGDVIQDGAMIVVDGIITAVGPRKDLSIPSTAKRHDFGSQVLIPGLVIAQSVLGGTQSEERTITPQIQALDGFDFFADRASLLESGLTTIQVSPAQNRLMPGVGGVVKLAGDELTDRILQDSESLQIVLTAASRQPPRIYEPSVGPVSEDRPLNATRPQVATLSASMAALRQILRVARPGYSGDDEVIQAVAAIVKAKTPLRISASTTPEIRGAVSLAREFDVKIILTDCVGLEAFEDGLADWKNYVAGVVLTAAAPGQIANPSIEQIEAQKQPWDFARELLDAGIPVAIAPSAGSQLTSSMFVAGQFMRDGLTPSELLTAMTHTPATMMNVADHVGSLQQGKHADFVVLSGQPFEMHSRVRATYVSGKPLVEKRPAAKATIVSADRIYVGGGKYLDGGQVLVKGKTIRGIGSDVSSPADATIRKYKGAVIVPGFVDMGTGLGLGRPLTGAVPLSTKLGEQLYPDDPAIEYARSNGITTALLVPAAAGGRPAPVVAFKLGDDVRVIGDPVALKFTMAGATSTAIATAEAQLVAGKKYVDSWKKYEKDLAEYNEKKKAEAAKPKAKPEPKKEETKKKEAEVKKPADKKDDEKKDKPKPDDKKDPEKKDPEKKKDGEKEKDKDKEDDKKKKKPLPDPVSGTWEGEIDLERLPAELRAFKFEMVLEEDGTVTGSVDMMRRSMEIVSGSYDRDSRELKITVERGGQESEISGILDASGAFEGSMEFGRMGEVTLTATRTVDKSKKPEPEDDEKEDKKEEKPEKKDPEKDKDKEDKKEKPKDGDDKDKKEGSKEKADSKESDKKEDKPAAEKKEEKKSELKEPKKPRANPALEPYKALFAGEIPAMVEARDLSTIKEAAKLFTEKYKVRTVIVGADALAREPAGLAGYSVSVIAGPRFSIAVPKQIDDTNLPQLLANERLPFAFQSSGTTGSGQLPGAIQFSISQGLSADDALDGLTSSAAKMLSDKSTFGSIRAGHDADLVVLSGPPFEFSTKVLAVMIDGVWVYERKEEK